MREFLILFSAPMVRAILEGRKTVTRRVVKPYRKQPIVNLAIAEPTLGFSGLHNDPDSWGYESLDDGAPASLSAWLELCPYGQRGDRLWVRESHRLVDCTCTETCRVPGHVWYEADSSGYGNASLNKLRPSIHMPRWASRIMLEVTAVRVERLSDISEDDARAEGVRQMSDGSGCWVSSEGPGRLVTPWLTAHAAFCDLWESINGAGSWDANPWVWVVEFKRLEIDA